MRHATSVMLVSVDDFEIARKSADDRQPDENLIRLAPVKTDRHLGPGYKQCSLFRVLVKTRRGLPVYRTDLDIGGEVVRLLNPGLSRVWP